MEEIKQHKIKNVNYRRFLDEGIINLIGVAELNKALQNVKGMYGKYINEGRSLLIALYYINYNHFLIILQNKILNRFLK